MQGKARWIAAAGLVAAAMIASPSSAWAGQYCSTYTQVASHNTGGDWVGGLLQSESMATVVRNMGGEVSTVSFTVSSGPVSTTVTSTSTTVGTTYTTQEPVGIYKMNDGTTWEVNCSTGEAKQVGGGGD